MLREIFIFIFFLHASHGDIDIENLLSSIADQDAKGECIQQFRHMDQLSFLKMIDSNPGLKPIGLMERNIYNFGNFDECLSISDDINKIYGKFCLASISKDHVSYSHNTHQINRSLSMALKMKKKWKGIGSKLLGTLQTPITINLLGNLNYGICVPDKCSSEDIRKLLPIDLKDSSCHTKFTNSKMDTNAVIALYIILGFIVLAILQTIYDVLCIITEIEPKYEFMIAFSLYTNGAKLFKIQNNSNQLSCLNGIKAISMMWVILGHTYMYNISAIPLDNYEFALKWLDDMKSMLILSASLSVDSFFTIGGILSVYVAMRVEQMGLKDSLKSLPTEFMHRYIRLTPAFAILVLAYGSGLVKYLSDGPINNVLMDSVNDCAKNWWTALLYVQNYVNTSNVCVSQSWYLSLDFQLYIISVSLVLPFKRWPQNMIKLLSVLAVIGMIIPSYMGYANKLSSVGLMQTENPAYLTYYYSTHTRFSPYLIGMIFGYYIHMIKKGRKSLVLRKVTLLIIWPLLIIGLLVCIFDGKKFVDDNSNEWLDGLYLGFNRPAWSMILCIIILLCCTDNGGPINAILSHPVFELISKLTYSMYLVHAIVIMVVFQSSRQTVHFTNFFVLTQFFSFLLITMGLSVLFSLIFESPMIVLEKVIFPRVKRKM